MSLQIFVGYDSREPIAYHILCSSILRRASGPVSFTPLVQPALREAGLYTRPRAKVESTEFSLTRFLVPHLSHFEGLSIFMDCDMLCHDDIYALVAEAEADPKRAVYVCQHDYTPKTTTKFLGQRQSVYPRKNWSSLMIFRNAYCRDLTPEYVNAAVPSVLHQMHWTHEDWIGALPLDWNHLVGEYEPNAAAKMFHYTLGGPWFRDYQHCDHAKAWFEELDLAMPSMNVPKPVGL